jgi:uncharacterized iron-regulated membrane protein
MNKFNYKHVLRKSHRYLGVFIGIQFVLWTLGGLYFSWTDLDEIHGDHLRSGSHSLSLPSQIVSPASVIERVKTAAPDAQIARVYVVDIMGKSYYAVEHKSAGKTSTVLADVTDGTVKPPISEDEARTIARHAMAGPGEIVRTTYLTAENVDAHHEYREKPMPAWEVTFAGDVNVYLSAETGQVGAVRTTKWRIFDFLWMLHTMDFQGRDNINNYVLRTFSILGIVTVLSGFSLFFVSSRLFRRLLITKRRRT